MTIFLFTFEHKNNQRIFIGIDNGYKKYKYGSKPFIYKVRGVIKYKLVPHFYEIVENIKIVDNPDFSKMEDKDIYFYNKIKNNIK